MLLWCCCFCGLPFASFLRASRISLSLPLLPQTIHPSIPLTHIPSHPTSHPIPSTRLTRGVHPQPLEVRRRGQVERQHQAADDEQATRQGAEQGDGDRHGDGGGAEDEGVDAFVFLLLCLFFVFVLRWIGLDWIGVWLVVLVACALNSLPVPNQYYSDLPSLRQKDLIIIIFI